jgi:NAD(P)-dependent dehydrogenase (short-subunit alcohol dehydrogenase family)
MVATDSVSEERAPRVWLITGVSTGLGRAIAQTALREGARVFGTVRQPVQQAAFDALTPGRARATLLDVTSPSDVRRAVDEAVAWGGTIDVLVNNAGYGALGAVEELTDEEIRRQFETNVFGVLAMTRAVLPVMRRQRRGRIVQISSVSGIVAPAGVGIYCASKFALEGFSESLAAEVAPLGINVTIVEPGAFRTDWAGRSLVWATEHSAYAETVGQMRERMKDWSGRQPGDPDKAAQAIVDLTSMTNPPLRLPLGADAVDRIRRKLESQLAALTEYESVARSTGF